MPISWNGRASIGIPTSFILKVPRQAAAPDAVPEALCQKGHGIWHWQMRTVHELCDDQGCLNRHVYLTVSLAKKI